MKARNTLALVLALLTGLVLGQVLILPQRTLPTVTARTHTTQVTAAAFYEAVNRYLESGDPGTVTQTLAANFRDHSGAGGDTGTEGFVRYLSALRTAWPDLRLNADSVISQADMAAVEITMTGGTTAIHTPLLDGMPLARGNEQLRIVSGKIAERWASAALPPQLEVLSTIEADVRSGWSLECAMEWLTLEPGTSKTLFEQSHSILIVVSGSIAMRVEQRDAPDPLLVSKEDVLGQSLIQRGSSIDLDGESVIQFPAEEHFRISNTGKEPATAIVVELQYRLPARTGLESGRGSIDPTISDTRQSPAELLPMTAGTKIPWVLSLARVAAAPSDELPVHAVSGLELALVTSGSLDVEGFAGTAFSFGPDGRTPLAGSRTLTPGTGIAASDEVVLSYRAGAESPAVFWFVTLVPSATAEE